LRVFVLANNERRRRFTCSELCDRISDCRRAEHQVKRRVASISTRKLRRRDSGTHARNSSRALASEGVQSTAGGRKRVFVLAN
jgi:hypothetical protein